MKHHRPQRKKKIPGKVTIRREFLQEYLETLATAQEFTRSNLRHWDLLQCYAELQFKLNGGARCPVCRAHVRHVLPVIAEHTDGSKAEFPCLCTRCFEGERAISRVVITQLGQARVEHFPHAYGKKTQDFTSVKPSKDRALKKKRKDHS